jgi:phosphate transport system substrate-binding protein
MNTVVRKTALLMLASSWMISGSAQTITIKGSDTLLGLSQRWADAYKAKHAGVALQVTGGGAPAAFAALAEKKLDIALASRSIRYKEAAACEAAFGQRPAEYKVAVSGLAVYVNTNNSVKVLTYDELFGIFKGKHRNWKELGGGELDISVYAQETNSVYGELFGEEVLNGKGITTEVHLLAGSDVLKAVANDPKAIGYGALTQMEGVRPLSIKRAFSSTPVVPSEEAIANRIYPISRFVYCYVNPTADKGETKAYLDWIRSDEGQQIAREAGYYPLPAKWRSSR